MQFLEVHSASQIDLPRDAEVIGSSNGLLCLRLNNNSSYPILLWNPAIRQVKLVPKAANCSAGKYFKWGFGFSSIVNDYKILRIIISDVLVSEGEVYSLKTGSWKKVESGTLDVVTIVPGSFAANGNIFWFGFKRNVEGMVHMLVSYDMAVEVFTLIPLPISARKPIDSIDTLYSKLTVHENKLAVLSHTTIGKSESLIDLWVMEEGTVTSRERWSWTKKYRMWHPGKLVPGTIWRNEIVCRLGLISATAHEVKGDERNVVLVNPTTEKFTMFAICKFGIGYPISNYVESLVPVGNNHIEEL